MRARATTKRACRRRSGATSHSPHSTQFGQYCGGFQRPDRERGSCRSLRLQRGGSGRSCKVSVLQRPDPQTRLSDEAAGEPTAGPREAGVGMGTRLRGGRASGARGRRVRLTMVGWLVVSALCAPPVAADVVLQGMPKYNWWGGCVPTSAGMIFGYWNDPDLYPFYDGDASVWSGASYSSNPADNQPSGTAAMIASWGHVHEGELADYNTSMGCGKWTPDLRDADCIADFMYTNNGSTTSSAALYGMKAFALWDNPATEDVNESVKVTTGIYWTFQSLDPWDVFRAEIDAGRPSTATRPMATSPSGTPGMTASATLPPARTSTVTASSGGRGTRRGRPHRPRIPTAQSICGCPGTSPTAPRTGRSILSSRSTPRRCPSRVRWCWCCSGSAGWPRGAGAGCHRPPSFARSWRVTRVGRSTAGYTLRRWPRGDAPAAGLVSLDLLPHSTRLASIIAQCACGEQVCAPVAANSTVPRGRPCRSAHGPRMSGLLTRRSVACGSEPVGGGAS